MTDVRVLDVTDKMKLLQWLYPEVYAKLVEEEEVENALRP